MLDRAEKAYCLALESLQAGEYQAALQQMETAALRFGEDPEFRLLHETTRLLVAVKRELAGRPTGEKLELTEVFSHEQETDLRG